jgi:N-acetylmuramic acid 6-phosphate etherase
MKNYCNIFISPEVGEEAITGSTRMKSGTAQKMILNMLTTGAMIKIGKTYENYMIDLQPTNEKLINRSVRIISEISGADIETASQYFEKSDKKVKTAIVMIKKNLSKSEAEKLLAFHRGILRKIID